MSKKVLLVDDEPRLLKSLSRHLKRQFDLYTAESGIVALELARTQGPFAVIVSDMNMPEMTGVELLESMHAKYPDTVRMMLTGNADQETPIHAINQGQIFRFFNKPVAIESLEKGIADALRQYELITAEKILLEQTLAGSVKVLMDILSIADPHAFGRATKVQVWAKDIAKGLHLPNAWEIKISALLSSIGRISIPDNVIQKLNKSMPLTDDEKEMTAKIPQIGKDLIINIPRLDEVAQNVFYQDKNFDGSGYPKDHLSGQSIPIGARLLRILKDLSDFSDGNLPTLNEIQQLDRWPERYDPELKRKVQGYFEFRIKKENDQPNVELKKMNISQLLAGYTVQSDIETEDGLLILAAGAKLSIAQVQRLHNLVQAYTFKEPVLVDITTRKGDGNE
ncbi:MAG: HD domain-containing phosphohydrolase [Terasakiella sp.]|uniref:HD domain-containing phosphohydrolase n=1 Tax=unclassified Terasakiella TaxID=2614952 RepID=UPI003B007975